VTLQSGGITRRDLLVAGGAAATGVALRPLRALAADPLPTLTTPSRLERFIGDRMDAGKLPGISAAIVRDGEVAWARGFGWANVRHDRPVERGTVFMLASVSKTVVCTAVLQAVEDGLFALDDDVNDALPFPVRVPTHPKRAITARHLLTHTSGIRDRWAVWDDLYSDGDSPIGLGEFLEGYLVPGGEDYRAANFYDVRPGTAYHYSNIGASLAAFLVEAAAGIGFDDWCESRIFGPLGMTTAGWHLTDVGTDDVAMPYRWSHDRERYLAYGQYGYPDYPDGALRTSARQLGHHLGMVMNDGEWRGVRVLSEDSVRELRRSQIPDIVSGQGLIWYRFHLHGRRLLGHNGGDIGVATVAFFEPATGIGVVVLANGNWRRDGLRWPLQQIMERLFDDADHLEQEDAA
jgi:CubicO group peptidase (beta-lactamase class C family)